MSVKHEAAQLLVQGLYLVWGYLRWSLEGCYGYVPVPWLAVTTLIPAIQQLTSYELFERRAMISITITGDGGHLRERRVDPIQGIWTCPGPVDGFRIRYSGSIPGKIEDKAYTPLY